MQLSTPIRSGVFWSHARSAWIMSIASSGGKIVAAFAKSENRASAPNGDGQVGGGLRRGIELRVDLIERALGCRIGDRQPQNAPPP